MPLILIGYALLTAADHFCLIFGGTTFKCFHEIFFVSQMNLIPWSWTSSLEYIGRYNLIERYSEIIYQPRNTNSSSRYSKSSVIALYASWIHIVSGFHFELRKTTTVTPSISLFGITSIIPASKIYRIVSTEKFSNISGQVFWSLKKFVTREWAFMSWLYKFQSSYGLIWLRLTYSQTFVMLYFSTRRNRVRKLSSSRLCVTEGSESWHKFRSSDICSFKFTLWRFRSCGVT